MATVWVIHDDGKRDLSDARRYGDLRTIFFKDIYPDEMDEKWKQCFTRAYTELRTYDVKQDFVCLVGAPLYTALVFYVMGALRLTGIRTLRYDKLERAYYPVQIG